MKRERRKKTERMRKSGKKSERQKMKREDDREKRVRERIKSIGNIENGCESARKKMERTVKFFTVL